MGGIRGGWCVNAQLRLSGADLELRRPFSTVESVMKVIARTSRFCTGLVAVGLSPVILRPIVNPTLPGFMWMLLAISVVVRVANLHLAVGNGFVRVQNFFRTTDVPIWEAEVDLGEPEPELGFNQYSKVNEETAGRMLYVVRPWHGDRVHVGVAPRFGVEARRIREELQLEIKRARAA